ncbi:hypothetical protein D4R51_01935 [bacterium]|nr:MAG: hypothetical protein D4R51_01935 [bacterium]
MLTADYIVGLTDGEGSFTVYLHPPHKKRFRYTPYYRVEWHYYIKLKDDDLSLLMKVRKFFRCGNVYFQKEKRVNHKNCYRFEVSSYRDVTDVIIPFFRKHQPQCPSRRNDFRILCRIHKIVSNKRGCHLTDVNVESIKKLKMQMHV